jgi:uncharacterized protein (TIGR02145 family)
MKKFIFTMGFTALMSSAVMNAQVTIGADQSPQPFSVLELISNNTRGLRLPQLTTVQRNALNLSALVEPEKTRAMGLEIFNLDNLCVETWNGVEWIAQCDCSRIISNTYSLCNGSTIADLTTAVGGGVEWYENATANTPLLTTAVLTSGTTYFAEQIGNCKNSEPRTPVTVTLGNCSTPLDIAAYSIFSPVSVMYTYQYQDLTLYKSITSSSDAVSFKWYVKKKGVAGNGTAITNANSATYRIPSNYRNSNDTLVFTCEYTNPITPNPQTVSTEIEFIKLDPANKIDINGVDYYWVELDVPSGTPSKNPYRNASGKLKVLATSLGTESANAADFGDLYQWGRVSDGHQTIGWTYTGTTSRIVAFDAITAANKIVLTGATYDNNNSAALEGGTPFWQITDAAHKGKFVFGSDAWRPKDGTDQYIWTTSAYAKTANDPCPSGWHVPSRYELGALVTGTPATIYKVGDTYNSSTSGSQTNVSVYNTWRYPSAGFGNSAHIGGTVVTQGSSTDGTTRLFLPGIGCRGDFDGTLVYIEGAGLYWSSTYDSYGGAFLLYVRSSRVETSSSGKGNGFMVRCVSE